MLNIRKLISVLIFLFVIGVVSSENALYNEGFTAPLCSSGAYYSFNKCVANSTIIGGSHTDEPNYPNTIDSCAETSILQPNINVLRVYEENDNPLGAGSPIIVEWEGDCITGDRVSWWLAYSLDPEAETPSWTVKRFLSDTAKYECQDGVFSSSTSDYSALTNRRIHIPNNFTGDYVAIRFGVSTSVTLYEEWFEDGLACPVATPRDVDDLVLSVGEPLPPTINIVGSFDVTHNTATISGSFSYMTYTNVTAYFILNDIQQTNTTYIKEFTSAQTHIQELTGLTASATYDYQLCLYYSHPENPNGTICSSLNYFTTNPAPPPLEEGTIDYMFEQLEVEGWAKTIAGFLIILAVLFLSIVAFGRSGSSMGAFGIIIVVFLGVVITTVLGLLPIYVIILFLVLILLAVILKATIGGGNNG